MDIAYSFGVGSMSTPTAPLSSIKLDSYHLTVYGWADRSTFVINGNSTLLYGASLNLQGQGWGLIPPAPLENNGYMTLTDSTLAIGALKGKGLISANRSAIEATSAVSSETIQVQSSQLYIGYGTTTPNPGMQFLAPVEGFDISSRVILENTHATMEVFFKASGALFLFDGIKMVADMHILGSPAMFASQITPVAGAPSVVLSAVNTGWHVIPTVVI